MSEQGTNRGVAHCQPHQTGGHPGPIPRGDVRVGAGGTPGPGAPLSPRPPLPFSLQVLPASPPVSLGARGGRQRGGWRYRHRTRGARSGGSRGTRSRTQVVRFSGPAGLGVEVLAPPPTPVPVGNGGGIATVGLDRGVGYRLRLTNITERPARELFPVIEVVGHLHRPAEIDPAKYPDSRRLQR